MYLNLGYSDSGGNIAKMVNQTSSQYTTNTNMPIMSNLNQGQLSGQIPLQMQQGGMYSGQPMSSGMQAPQYFQGKPVMGQTNLPATGFTSQSMGGMPQQGQQNPQQMNYGMNMNGGQPMMQPQGQMMQGPGGQMVPMQGNLGQQMRPPVPSVKPANIPKPWHQASDAHFRKSMNDSIVHLLEQKKPNAADWRAKLPQMAAKLEENLYFSANSLEEYVDVTSLKSRLQQLAVQMGGKQPHPSNPTGQGQLQPVGNRPGIAPNGANGIPNQGNYIAAGAPGQPPQYQNQMMGMPQMNNGGMNGANGNGMQNRNAYSMAVAPNGMNMGTQQTNVDNKSNQQFVTMAQINPILAQPSLAGPNGRGPNGPSSVNGVGGQGSIGSAGANTEEHRRQVLKQQQQRLLLLRHASKCTNDSDCRVTPHCASMKVLWKHIMSCKNQECKTAHCVSSRYVLSHYSKCKDHHCPVCAPVREAIRQSLSKVGGKPDDHTHGHGHNINQRQPFHDEHQPNPKKVRLTMRDQAQHHMMMPPAPMLPLPSNKPLANLDPVSCGLYCLTNEQIQAHINGIHEGMGITASKVKEICMPLIDKLLKYNGAYSIFGLPVDPVFLSLPDYFEKIKRPMDLGTIKKRLESFHYRDTSYVSRDVHLTFDNAMSYNPKNSTVYSLAKQMKKDFDSDLKQALTVHQSRLENNRLNHEACSICGETRLAFEPPVYYCNGNCGGQRIRRNAFYFSAGNNNYHWCLQCFNDMKENTPVPVGDAFIAKSELAKTKRKHQDDAEERWVGCDGCQRWVHDICALFNSRRNFGDDTKFSCPTCLIARRRTAADGLVSALTSKTKAIDLPHSNMSQFIEGRIAKKLNEAYEEDAALRGVPVSEVEKCPPLVLRQVSCIDKNQPVRDGVRDRYKHKNYPSEFPCRTKCIVLFQNIDGQDVILFGMYVYEYGHKCPPPNQRRVYVSYLDSVHYFRPKQFRTLVYHEILLAYLEYVKRRGFHTAHIWSCPPSKGDDYIFYCHPNDQKTPKSDKLQKWYADMLDEGLKRELIEEVVDIHTEYLTDPSYDATVLPYFEGDYWTTEAEVIIKNLLTESKTEDTEVAEDNADGQKSKRKNKAAAAANRPTRGNKAAVSTIASRPDRDPVMAKLATIIEPMKNTFFVARLRSREYAEQCALARQKELLIEAEERENASRRMSSDGSTTTEGTKESGEAEESTSSTQDTSNAPSSAPDVEASPRTTRSRAKANEAMETDDPSQSVAESKPSEGAQDASVTESKEAEPSDEVKTENNAGDSSSAVVKVETESEAPTVEEVTASFESKLDIKDDTEDLDDTMDSEHWDTRQYFLNLCQGNHYQFDQLRRAKYSTLLVLYLMHNPDAPKFLSHCHMCSKEINTGLRRRCEQCDWEFCQTCYSQLGNRIHHHSLRAIPVSGNAPVQQMSAQERAERQKALKVHLELLQHSAYCEDSNCKDKRNCLKMKVNLKILLSCIIHIQHYI